MSRVRLLPVALALAFSPPARAADWSPRDHGTVRGLIARSAAAPDRGRPLLVVLHGCAQPNAALQQAGLAEAAERAGGVVALPAVPSGGVYAGCWDYYGPTHTDSNRHLGPLIAFVEALVGDPALQIDPARVWIAGLSSGAGEALVAACVAPDLFSGVAAVGGPGLGTEATQIAQVATSAGAVEDLCARLSRAPAAFARQQAVFLVGTSDYIVAQGYAPVNAAGFAALYGAAPSRSIDLRDLPGGAAGDGTLWSASGIDRVALLTVAGLDHAWPAGRGGGATMQFVAPGGPDLGAWLFEFFGGVEPAEPGPPPSPEPAPEPCAPQAPESIVDTLIGHAPRLGVHAGSYGAVDASYVDLLGRHGTATPFPLYRGPDGWYHDPANLPTAECAPEPAPPPAGEPEPTPTPAPGLTPEPEGAGGGGRGGGPRVVKTDRGCAQASGAEGRWGWALAMLLGALGRRRQR